MRQNRGGFTLVELIIGLGISAVLMTAILVFVSSGIGNLVSTRKMMEQSIESKGGNDEISFIASTTAGHILASGSLESYGSWVLLFDSGSITPYVLISARTYTGFCDAQKESNTEDGTIQKLFIAKALSPTNHLQEWDFVLNTEHHTLSASWVILIGKDMEAGNMLTEWGSGFSARLNHPSALLLSWSLLFVADTGNDRILAYNTLDKTIRTLLPSIAGLSYPYSLAQDGAALTASGLNLTARILDGDIDGRTISFFTGTIDQPRIFDRVKIKAEHLTLPSSTGSYEIYGTSPENISSDTLLFASNQNIPSGSLVQFRDLVASGVIPPGLQSVQLTFYSWSEEVWTQTFSHFVQGDGDIATMTGNSIAVIPSILPTSVSIASLPMIDSTIWSRPISHLTWSSDSHILTLHWTEYIHYDCRAWNHLSRERFAKIPLQ